MKKIIIATVSSVLVIILSVTVLVLAFIPTNQNDVIALPWNIYITNKLTKDNAGDDGVYILRGNKQRSTIQKIYELFNKNFGQKLLTAIFNGEIHNKLTVGHNDALGAQETMTKNYDASDKYTMIFEYTDIQKLNYRGKTVEYNLLFFELTDSDERGRVKFGVCKKPEQVESDDERILSRENESIPYSYYYYMNINLKNVYDYVSNISYFKEQAESSEK